MHVFTRIFGAIGAFVSAAAVSGCAVGPDFHTVAAPAVSGYTSKPLPAHTASADAIGGDPQSLQPGGDIPGQWWSLFHSAQLDRLIDEALKATPNLAAAQAALRVTQETAAAEQGYLYPSVNAYVTGIRERRLFYKTGVPTGISAPFNLENAGVNVSYTLDVFGGIRRQLEAFGAQSEYQKFLLEATYLTLTADVVTTAIQEASLRGQIAATLTRAAGFKPSRCDDP
jgi:outer membrane protein TolC